MGERAVSQREFARILGVSNTTVGRAIRNGRILTNADGTVNLSERKRFEVMRDDRKETDEHFFRKQARPEAERETQVAPATSPICRAINALDDAIEAGDLVPSEIAREGVRGWQALLRLAINQPEKEVKPVRNRPGAPLQNLKRAKKWP